MTAVVGILNKTAVALAADSAVTVTGENGRKIFNTANKIFKLSKFHPVGIAIYNAASLVRTPWEIIIKAYREQLNGTSFATVDEYKDNFLEYLRSNDKYVTDAAQKQLFKAILGLLILHFDDKYKNEGGAPSDEEGETLLAHLVGKLKEYLQEFIDANNQSERNAGFKDVTEDHLDSFVSSVPTEEVFSEYEIVDPELKEMFKEAVKSYVRSDNYHFNWSGLIFCGYGEDEIFPSLVSIKVGEVFGGVVRWNEHQECVIDDGNTGAILPFAQTDVIETIIEGVSPKMNSFYEGAVADFLNKYNDIIVGLLDKEGADWDEVRAKISAIDIAEIAKALNDKIEEAKMAQSIAPTVQTVSILSKEDLGEMAESLIYMTYLKRRIMSDEESVGGPVDVAIISKTDGFIWIKRKYYFKPELNPHFLHNYFKNS